MVRPGFAEVIFNSAADAQSAVAQYNGRELDGRPMKVTLATTIPTTPLLAPVVTTSSIRCLIALLFDASKGVALPDRRQYHGAFKVDDEERAQPSSVVFDRLGVSLRCRSEFYSPVMLSKSESAFGTLLAARWMDIMKMVSNRSQPMAICFVEFASAFDSFHCESLWGTMELDDVPTKNIAMIKAYYHFTTAIVLIHNDLSQPFDIRSGV
ncbi:unnamed protein product [Schistocephalus solidus]|uniref:RRM domain-containing protein n=1 Tax=Schistocephalus solidus TaxID=70667 RepID=A0A183TJA8_SCHSO|nr:unnamed protein product [Schistocephalus solidus]